MTPKQNAKLMLEICLSKTKLFIFIIYYTYNKLRDKIFITILILTVLIFIFILGMIFFYLLSNINQNIFKVNAK